MLILDAPGFVGGFVHPLLAPAHLLSLIGLGLLAGGAVGRASIIIVAAFALGLSAGLGAVGCRRDPSK
jgi:hydrogenase/urease accessory protein HupE